jgi:hypothetical protein
MTWRFKVQGVVFALVVLGALAVAAGDGWVDDLLAMLGLGY